MQQKYSWVNSELFKIIERQSIYNKIDYKIVCAIIDAESKGHNNAISPSGAKGLMQIMPFWTNDNLFDSEINIIWGTKIFANYLKQASGNIVFALRNYERGPMGKGININYTAKIIYNYYNF